MPLGPTTRFDHVRRAMRLGLIAACALLVFFLTWRTWVSSPDGDHEPRGPEPSEVAGESIDLSDAQDRARRSAASTSENTVSAARSAPEAAASVETETIEGVLRVFDDDDIAHDEEDGSFLLTEADERDGRTIDVRSGRWRTKVRAHGEYRVEDVLAGGRPAVTAQARQPARRADGNGWEVIARWARSTVLVVRGLDNGLDLAGVDVAADVPNGGLDGCHPGQVAEEHWIARDARSPIPVPPHSAGHWSSGTRELYVRAPGYAWGCVRVPESLGGEYLVALAPGGTLEILLGGLDASEADAVIRLRPADKPEAEPIFEERVANRALVRIDGLESGRWLATVELGHRYRWPQVLARGEVDLPAGGLAHLELAVEALPNPAMAPLSGRVVASPEWKFQEVPLRLELLDEAPRGHASAKHAVVATRASERSAEGRDVWEWSVEDGAMPGRWSVEYFPLGLGLAVDVPPAGRSDVVLEIPEPVAVEVLTLDSDTGRPETDGRTNWMPVRGWSNIGGELMETDSLGEGRFTFRAPRGRIELWCFPEHHRFRREVIEASPPRVEQVVRLDPSCGFVLRVRDGNTLLPWPMRPGWSREVARLDGDGKGWIEDQDANWIETRFVVTAPGRYRLDLPTLPGYAALPPQEIVVSPGRFVRHDVVLTRR